jgi:protein gp37
LHPIDTGKCWAASICRRFAGPFAESEVNLSMEVAIHKKYSIPNLKNEKKRRENEIKKKFEEFKPTWLESQFQKRFPKKRASILVDYMTDIAYIPPLWVKKIIDRIKKDNRERDAARLERHIFQFLTKKSAKYHEFNFPHNCWLGYTATTQNEHDYRFSCMCQNKIGNIMYAYFEPMREKIEMHVYSRLDWVIVGGGDQPLDPEWVRSIRDQCKSSGIPLYFKSWGQYYPGLKRKVKTSRNLPNNILDGEIWEQFPEVQ